MKAVLPVYLSARIQNKYERDAWVPLPAPREQFREVLKSLYADDDNDFEIVEYATNIPGLTNKMLMKTALGQVNCLAARLRELECEHLHVLQAIAASKSPFGNVEDFIRFTFQAGDYSLLPGITTDVALGRHFLSDEANIRLPEQWKTDRFTVDYFGFFIQMANGGELTPAGYLHRNYSACGEAPETAAEPCPFYTDAPEQKKCLFPLRFGKGRAPEASAYSYHGCLYDLGDDICTYPHSGEYMKRRGIHPCRKGKVRRDELNWDGCLEYEEEM